MIPETEHPDSRARQFRAPLRIILLLPVFGMAAAVKLNSQLCVMTIEVENVPPNRVLPPELDPTEPAVSEKLPHELLRVGLGFPQEAGIMQDIGRNGHVSLFPLIRPSATFSPWEKARQAKPVKHALSHRERVAQSAG